MKANELRVGNLVQKDGEVFVSDHITILMAHNYQPIPLTQGILVKAGFERSYAYYVIGCDTISICYSVNEGLYSTFVLGDNKINNILFVHQLQNLYFALTGEEFEISM